MMAEPKLGCSAWHSTPTTPRTAECSFLIQVREQPSPFQSHISEFRRGPNGLLDPTTERIL